MDAETIIEQVRQMPTEEQDRVAEALANLRAERENARISEQRIQELCEGKVKPLSHDAVFETVRARVREA